MKSFEIWRFENKLVKVCGEMLNDALRLVGCDMPTKVFLVGFHLRTGTATVIPDDRSIDTTELENELQPVAAGAVTFPDDPEMTDDDWGKQFQQHDRYLSMCWSAIRDVVESELSGQFRMVSVSPCCEMNGFVVAIVATYSRFDYEKYTARLDMSIHRDNGRWPSLHFGVVEAVLNDFAEELRMKDAGRRHGFETDSARELVRIAGAFFTKTHAWAGKRFSPLDIQFRGTLDFFETCNSIASMRYESRVGLGTMIVADRAHIAVKTVIEYELPFLVTEFRRTRKLLEMCRDGLSVLTDSRYVWGLGRLIDEVYFPAKAEVMTVRFVGQGHWRLAHQKLDLMDVLYGEPKLPQLQERLKDAKAKIKSKFPKLKPGADEALIALVSYAVEAEHGTMLVITERAVEHAAALTKPNCGIKPFDPDKGTIAAASAIDGSIIVDLSGKCHGVGVILDGLAGDGENPARGSRYNSAVRYVRGHPDSLIVVVSEDRTVDVVVGAAPPEEEPCEHD